MFTFRFNCPHEVAGLCDGDNRYWVSCLSLIGIALQVNLGLEVAETIGGTTKTFCSYEVLGLCASLNLEATSL